jgi:hypothetical protein
MSKEIVSKEMLQQDFSDYSSKLQLTDKIKLDALTAELYAANMKNVVLQRQIKEFVMQLDLLSIELNRLKASQNVYEQEIDSYKVKLQKMETRKESIINELTILNKVCIA